MIWNALLCSLLLGGDFKAANQLYDAGKFADAAAAYEKVEPQTANVYFNLGNALFRQEKYGLALLNYERARRLAPRDPDVLANLKFAEQRLAVNELNTPSSAYRRLARAVIGSRTTSEWSRYEVAALWLTILAVAGAVWLPRARTGMILIAIIAGLATAATASILVVEARTAPMAIVVAGKADARFAPTADATVHFVLPEGAKVSVREDRGAWLLVERADSQQGWAPSDALESIGTTTAK
jgi:tetratricopeptide (TPR) repeat protein